MATRENTATDSVKKGRPGRLIWLQVGRLAVLGSLSVLGMVYLEPLRLIYLAVACAVVVTAAAAWLFLRKRPRILWPYWIISGLDSLLLGVLIHYAGGIDGPFVVFFYLHAAVAGLYLGLSGGLAMAVLDMIVLATSGVLTLSGAPPEYAGGMLAFLGRSGMLEISTNYILLRSFLDGLILASIGLVAGYLSEHLIQESGRLQQLIKALRETRARSREVLESLADGVLVVDNEGELVSVNRACREMLGLGEGGADLRETRVHKLLLDYLGGGLFPENIDLVLGERIVECRMGRFVDEDGENAGAIAVLTEVTELRDLRSRLEEREKLAIVGRLASTMAHEIRNPLASMSGAAQILSQGELDLEKAGRMSSLIVNQARRISETIEGYLQMSRRNSSASFEDLKLGAVLQKVLDEGRTATLPDVEIRSSIRQDLIVRGSAARMTQMMQNLLRNAAEATEGQERRIMAVGLGYNPRRGSAEITVEDNGPGFPEGLADSISRPFVTTKREGTGLGLYVASKVAEDHGGSILFDASTLGGALVKVSLPGCKLADELEGEAAVSDGS